MNQANGITISGGASGGGGTPATGSSLTKISTQTLVSTATSVSFNSIPQTFTALLIIFNTSGTVSDNLSIQFNGDTGSNYAYSLLYNNGGTPAALSSASTANPLAAFLSIAPAVNSGTLTLAGYAGTVQTKTGVGATQSSTSGFGVTSFAWNNTAAITSIKLYPATGGANAFSIGSTFTLYGVS